MREPVVPPWRDSLILTLQYRGFILSAMAIVLIPARWVSSRLPGKALAEIAGKPMIEHVYSRSLEARGIDRVIVATDHQGIADAVKGFGGEAVMTGECPTGTDRVAKVAAGLDCDIVINVQGDEPLIPPEMIEEALAPLKDDNAEKMATLKRLFRPDENPGEPQAVKVVTDLNDYALYFSRSLMPYPRERIEDCRLQVEDFFQSSHASGVNKSTIEKGPFLHVGIYAYRRDFLLEFASWPSTPLELIEGLEQLRALERGHRIKAPTTEHFSIGVDTPDDLARVRKLMGKIE